MAAVDVKGVVSRARDADEAALALHRELRGKLSVSPKVELTDDTLELLYTPGVGAVSREIASDALLARDLTGVANTVAVVSDGSAVLGLGNEGPLAALPVLEGKALLFRVLAGIDAVPVALDVDGVERFVETVVAIAPGFGAINLEDIAAPACFEIEARLRERLKIPVVHDDQHGTAIVVLAALINASRVAGLELEQARVVVVGAGAGGAATARLLHAHGTERLIVCDSHGPLSGDRDDLDEAKQALVDDLSLKGTDDVHQTSDAIRGANVVIGLSSPGAFSSEEVRAMADPAIVFALANPDPEVDPAQASEAGATVVATGRSDYPNQVNNVLAFPGLFRGALDAGLERVDEAAALRAASALADLVTEPTAESILPSALEDCVVPAVASAVANAGGSQAKQRP